MKTLQKVGGISALVCAATYILAMGLLTTVLTPMADSSLSFDPFIAFFLPHQTLIFIWHFAMYLVNGTFLALLILALTQQLKTGAPALALAAACFGLLWTAMVFASGFITLYGWETIGKLAATDPAQASTLRLVVDTVTGGIDHSDRFLGCLWVLLTSWAALHTGQLAKPLNFLGVAIGMAGIVSSVAPSMNALGYAFGLGVIVWWIWLGIVLLQSSRSTSSQPLNFAVEAQGLNSNQNEIAPFPLLGRGQTLVPFSGNVAPPSRKIGLIDSRSQFDMSLA